MLLKSKIAPFKPYSDEWFNSHEAMLTGSRINVFCGSKGLGDGAYTYIRQKIWKRLTGQGSEKNITTEEMLFGIENEPKSLEAFAKLNNIEFLVTDRTIIHDDLFSVTPDALWIKAVLSDGNYNAEPIETKSMQGVNHLAVLKCTKPEHLLSSMPQKFWQVISQIEWSGAMVGHFLAFNPNAPENIRLHHIPFRKIELIQHFKHFNKCCEEARGVFNSEMEYYKTKLIQPI
jgi:hypothetical protein